MKSVPKFNFVWGWNGLHFRVGVTFTHRFILNKRWTLTSRYSLGSSRNFGLNKEFWEVFKDKISASLYSEIINTVKLWLNFCERFLKALKSAFLQSSNLNKAFIEFLQKLWKHRFSDLLCFYKNRNNADTKHWLRDLLLLTIETEHEFISKSNFLMLLKFWDNFWSKL